MDSLISGSGWISEWLSVYLIAIARLSFIIFLMPGIGEQAIPIRVRVTLMLGIALAFSTSPAMPAAPITSTLAFLVTLAGELLIGLALGVSLRLVIWVLQIAGSIIAQSIGLAQFLGVALEHEAQTITANMLSMAGATLLLTADYHISAFVALLGLYETIPVGMAQSLELSILMESFFAAMTFGVTLAWPFVAVNLIYNICLGFINKAMPQMMVAFVGAPFMVGAGLLLLSVSVMALLAVWMSETSRFFGWM